ncbi:unnamed protein product [Auanema sp. JU1783]|nr:unnamed protein product [Auanema sp. JU1783]
MRIIIRFLIFFALLRSTVGQDRVVYNSAYNPMDNITYGPLERPRCYLGYICPLLFACRGGYCLYSHEAAERKRQRDKNKPGFFKNLFNAFWPF